LGALVRPVSRQRGQPAGTGLVQRPDISADPRPCDNPGMVLEDVLFAPGEAARGRTTALSKSPSTRPRGRRPDVHLQRPESLDDLIPARPSSSSSGAARRWLSSSATRHRPTGSASSRLPPGCGGRAAPSPLGLSLARWIADHYLAPPAVVIRAMLPPGLLERLDLVAERSRMLHRLISRRGRGPPDPAGAWTAGSPGDGRTGWSGRPHAAAPRLAETGQLALDWTLSVAGAGRDSNAGSGRRRRVARRRSSLRQGIARQAASLVLARWPLSRSSRALAKATSRPATSRAARPRALAGLVRRGLATVDVRERPRIPLATRAVGLRGSRPPGAPLTGPQAEAVSAATAAIVAGDPTPLLLDGVTGGGKTAIYVEAIAASLELGRRALVLVPEIAMAMPLVDRLRADLAARVALVHSGLGDGERADEWRRIRSGDVDIVVGTRLAVLARSPMSAWSSSTRSTKESTRVIGRHGCRPGTRPSASPSWPARRLSSAARRPQSTASAVPERQYRRVVLPSRPVGSRPTIEVVDLRPSFARAIAASCPRC